MVEAVSYLPGTIILDLPTTSTPFGATVTRTSYFNRANSQTQILVTASPSLVFGDTNLNGCVSTGELFSFIDGWYLNNIETGYLFNVINSWYSDGC